MVNCNVNVVCETCTVRIPKYQRKLKCYMCHEIKHYKCQNLSKSNVEAINNVNGYDWMCYECISSILPVCATSRRKNTTQTRSKITCSACKGSSYSAMNTIICTWCGGVCHKKCIKGELGYINCCDTIIPGYRYHAYELLDIGGWR